MNANLQPQTPAIKTWLKNSSNNLSKAGIPSPDLDCEVILADTLNVSRTYLHAHPDDLIEKNKLKTANEKIKQRLDRIPIAYILGYKEFYGQKFIVNNSVLIPRPESENIIDILKSEIKKPNSKLVDVGTGSGCLGITAKLEIPELDVTLVDICPNALKIAQNNASQLKAKVSTNISDLLNSCDQKFDIIIANLPYVNQSWETSPETRFEPDLALYADDNGTFLIKKLIIQCGSKLRKNGILIIESDTLQHKELADFAKNHHLEKIDENDLILAFTKN